MVNVTPKRPSIIGMVIGLALLFVGAYLLYVRWEQLKDLLFIFAGFFLLLFGLGIFTASVARR
jgi:sulfite exporter TauE/SafE